MPLVLHITDCHLVAPGQTLLGVDTQASLEAVLHQAFAQHIPDAIIASGDIAHDPFVHVYERFISTIKQHVAALSRGDMPLLCLPGNHDLLAPMQAAALPMSPVEIGEWTLVGLDSHEDDAQPARIDARDRAQVAAGLRAASTPHVLVATHHPLVEVGCPWLDVDRIQNSSDLVHWLAECNPRVRGLIFGHAHQEVAAECGRGSVTKPVWGTPSTCFQFQPSSAQFSLAQPSSGSAADDSAAPGYRWLWLAADGSVKTEVARAANFAMKPIMPEALGGPPA